MMQVTCCAHAQSFVHNNNYGSQNKRPFTALLTVKQQRKSEVSRRPPLRHIGDGSEGDQGGRAQVSATGTQGGTTHNTNYAYWRNPGKRFRRSFSGPVDRMAVYLHGALPKMYCFLHQCTYSLYHLLRAVLLRMCILF